MYNNNIIAQHEFRHKYRCYQFIDYLMGIFDKQFEYEFDIDKNILPSMMSDIIREKNTTDPGTLSIAAKIAKHVE